MPTIRISFDNLSDLLAQKSGNAIADEQVVPTLMEVIRKGGNVVVDLAGEQAELVLKGNNLALELKRKVP